MLILAIKAIKCDCYYNIYEVNPKLTHILI